MDSADEGALLRIEPHRRQFYVNLIRQFFVSRRSLDVPLSIGDITFPRLSSLSVAGTHPFSRYAPHLQQRLTHFTLLGRPTLELAQALTALCPRLRSLFLGPRLPSRSSSSNSNSSSSSADSATRSATELADFFRSCALLPVAEIAVTCPAPDSGATAALLEVLAQRPALASLNLHVGEVDVAASLAAVANLERRSGGTAVPFGQLRRLRLVAESAYVKFVPLAMPSVTCLNLLLHGDAGTALAAVAALSCLMELDFRTAPRQGRCQTATLPRLLRFAAYGRLSSHPTAAIIPRALLAMV